MQMRSQRDMLAGVAPQAMLNLHKTKGYKLQINVLHTMTIAAAASARCPHENAGSQHRPYQSLLMKLMPRAHCFRHVRFSRPAFLLRY